MDTFKLLKDNLTRYYVFYIPTEAISKLESTIFKGLLPMEASNTIAYFDDDKKVSTNFENVNVFNFVGKKEILDDNVSLLFEAKQKLDDTHFGFLLDKYLKFIEAHLFATKWMFNHINNVFANPEEHIVTLFKVQKENFEIHNSELTQHFDIKKLGGLDENHQFETHFEDSFSNSDFKIEVPKFPNSNLVLKPKIKSDKKKKELISEEEIDRFLLTTVFNVEL